MEGPSESIGDDDDDNDDSGAHATAKRKRESEDQLESTQKKLKAADDRNIKQAEEVSVAA